MDNVTAVVKHKNMIRNAVAAFVAIVIQICFFVVLRDVFVVAGHIFIAIVVVCEVGFFLWMLLKGFSEEYLDKEGLTLKTPLGTKHYAWKDIREYGVDKIAYKQRSAWGHKYIDVPRFRLYCGNRTISIDYREDTKECLRRYCGLPVYNKWEEETQ